MKKDIPKTITLRDVAALAGMDTATVSRALSGKGYVSQQKRDAALADHDLGVLSRQGFFIRSRLQEQGFDVQYHDVPRWIHQSEAK